MKIKTEIKYLSNIRPKIEAFVLPVCEGVWHVYIDWYEALKLDATGGSSDSTIIEMFFSHPASKEIDIQVDLHLPVEGHLFGAVSKKSYHGTFYSEEKYTQLIDEELPKCLGDK